MSTLRLEGLVSSGRGRRSIVLSTVPSQPFDTVLSFTQWCQQKDITSGQKTLWIKRAPAEPTMSAALDIKDGDPVVSLLRLRLVDDEPVMLERLNYPLEFGQHVLAFDPDSGSIYQQLIDSGVDIHHATRTIDAVAAPEEDAQLLGITAGDPLLRIKRRAFTREGRPIENSDDRYLPQHSQFTLTATRETPAPGSMIGLG